MTDRPRRQRVLTQGKYRSAVPDGCAAPADSSWYRNPSGGRRFHAPDPTGLASACGIVVLDEDAAVPFDEVPEVLRCRRAACRNIYDREATR